MSRRYSFLPLRPWDIGSSWTGGSSKASTTTGSSSPGFFYPPLQPAQEGDLTSSPPLAHPYQTAAFDNPPHVGITETEVGISRFSHDTVLGQPATRSMEQGSEKPLVGSSLGRSANRFLEGLQQQQQRTRTPSTRAPDLLSRMRPIFLVFMFLPFPPLLSLVYLLIGHTILRHIHPAPNPEWQASLMSSAGAGATGGILLSVPLALLLYVLTSSTKPAAQADFFEDDESLLTRSPALRYVGYAACSALAVCVGGVAGPLGVVCVGGAGAAVGRGTTLSAGGAAQAGFLGGALLSGGVLLIFGVGVCGWAVWARSKAPQ